MTPPPPLTPTAPSGRALAVLSRFPGHLAATDPDKRFEHVVDTLAGPLDVQTRQLGDVRRGHRLSDAPTLADVTALADLHGLASSAWGLVTRRLQVLSAAVRAEPLDPARVADLAGLGPDDVAALVDAPVGVTDVVDVATRHTAVLELRRDVVRAVVAAHVIGNATPSALLRAAAGYLGLEVEDVHHTSDRWWHLATCYDLVELRGADGARIAPVADLLALEENPFRSADLAPVRRRHAQRFAVTRGGLDDVDVTVRVAGVGTRTVRPMVVSVDDGRGLCFEGEVPDGSELRFETSGQVRLGGVDVTGSAWGFTGAVFSSTDLTPRRAAGQSLEFVFDGEDAAAGGRPARFVTTTPVADVLDGRTTLPHGAPGVPPLRLPLGVSRWVAFVRPARSATGDTAADLGVARHHLGRFDAGVFADDAAASPLDGPRTGEHSLAVGFDWEEREPFAVRVLLPRRLSAGDDDDGSLVREPLRALLARHRAAGVDVRVEYADPRWTLGTGVVRDEPDEAVGTVLSGSELWPDPEEVPV